MILGLIIGFIVGAWFGVVLLALLVAGRDDRVRCKACRHRVHDEERGLYYCEMYYGQGDVSDENFCQWGERREE